MPDGFDTKLIATKFAMHGYNIHPSAIEVLRKSVTPQNLDFVISHICKIVNSFIITPEDILSALETIKEFEKKARAREAKSEVKKPKQQYKVEGEIKIKDITGRSSCEGGIEDFIAYFNSRFEKLSGILRGRIKPIPISALSKFIGERVEVVGIVNDVRETQNGAIIELEDKTGSINVIVLNGLKDQALELLGDEVIGVTGDVRGKSLIADRIVFPEVPIREKVRKDFGVAFISDTHFGSKEFLQKEWDMFTRWLSGELGEGKVVELAEKVKYLIIAGDIVDGVGIYPDQEKDLAILDIYEQYEFAAEQLDKIPKEIKIILSVGNHDAIRQAEPQPALPKEYRELFSNNVIHVGNPAFVELDGLKVLIYHGRSLDDVITRIPRLSYERPHEAMIELLKRRHLSPIYGEKTPIAPEKEDWLVIDEIPDVLHCGHVHTYSVGFYRGVFLVNSSTWQSQTEFQKKVNLNPMPGNVAVYYNGEVGRLRFYD
jgi:DNA polymerase II small subunit